MSTTIRNITAELNISTLMQSKIRRIQLDGMSVCAHYIQSYLKPRFIVSNPQKLLAAMKKKTVTKAIILGDSAVGKTSLLHS